MEEIKIKKRKLQMFFIDGTCHEPIYVTKVEKITDSILLVETEDRQIILNTDSIKMMIIDK